MVTRKRNLEIGEAVFDYERRLWCRIVSLNQKTAVVAQRDMLQRNISEIDCDAELDDEEWKTNRGNLYQEAEGIVDNNGNHVCFEHLVNGYPYYSPAKDENLFSMEVFVSNGEFVE